MVAAIRQTNDTTKAEVKNSYDANGELICCACPPLKPEEKVIVGGRSTRDQPALSDTKWNQDTMPDNRCCVCPAKPAKKTTFEEISDEVKKLPAEAGANSYKL